MQTETWEKLFDTYCAFTQACIWGGAGRGSALFESLQNDAAHGPRGGPGVSQKTRRGTRKARPSTSAMSEDGTLKPRPFSLLAGGTGRSSLLETGVCCGMGEARRKIDFYERSGSSMSLRPPGSNIFVSAEVIKHPAVCTLTRTHTHPHRLTDCAMWPQPQEGPSRHGCTPGACGMSWGCAWAWT